MTNSLYAWRDKPKTITAGEHDSLEGDRMTLDKLRVEIRRVTPEDLAWLRSRNGKLFSVLVGLTSIVAVDDEEAAENAKAFAEAA